MLALGLLLPRATILHPNLCYAVGGEPRDYAEYGGGYNECIIRFR